MTDPAATVDRVTMIRRDLLSPAGMHGASSAGSTRADLVGLFWATQSERRGVVSQASRFRSFRCQRSAAVAEHRDRKSGSEQQSHNLLTFGVCPAGNVA